MNLDPAFSSESFKGLNRQTTFMLSSAAISRSRCSLDIFLTLKTPYTKIYIIWELKTVHKLR